MIKRFDFSPIIRTGAVVRDLPYTDGMPAPFTLKDNSFVLQMDDKTRVYGVRTLSDVLRILSETELHICAHMHIHTRHLP